MDTTMSLFRYRLKHASDWVASTFEAPFSGAVLFGVPVGGHLFLEGLLLVVIFFLLSQKSYKPPKRPLTKKEIDELCDEWVPEPLIPTITNEMKHEPQVLESAAGPHTVIDGKEVVNFTSANYLGLVGHDKILETCTTALEKYGVGSCGPRGFYGTIDVHLDCEARLAKFIGTPDSILYSYGLSTMFSAIPAFCKKGDVIVVDEGVHWGIQNGLQLSRSTIIYFKHNNMESLRNTLEKVTQENKRAKKLRRYIVVEALYQNSGQIAPLDAIIELKEQYKFRVIVDESNSFGVLGSSGRGLTEHFRVPVDKIDIITAAMGHALATEGGFCTGSNRVIDHQRLSSSGYVFSASLPPYLASAAIKAIDILEENPSLITKLRANIKLMHKVLEDTMMMGADYYQTEADFASLLANGKVPIGIISNTKIRNCIMETDAVFAKSCSLDSALSSGTTALTAMIFGRSLLVANAGDCRAVLSRHGLAIEMSKDHRPCCFNERARIESLGGFVDDGYLNGQLGVTRALGDWHIQGLKEGNNSGPLSAEPELKLITLCKEDEFLIIGSDGIWDVFTSQNAVDFARRRLQVHNNVKLCCKEIVDEAKKRGAVDKDRVFRFRDSKEGSSLLSSSDGES